MSRIRKRTFAGTHLFKLIFFAFVVASEPNMMVPAAKMTRKKIRHLLSSGYENATFSIGQAYCQIAN